MENIFLRFEAFPSSANTMLVLIISISSFRAGGFRKQSFLLNKARKYFKPS